MLNTNASPDCQQQSSEKPQNLYAVDYTGEMRPTAFYWQIGYMGLDKSELFVLFHLYVHSYEKKYCEHSQRELSSCLGMDRRTIRAVLDRLVEKGLIRKLQRPDNDSAHGYGILPIRFWQWPGEEVPEIVRQGTAPRLFESPKPAPTIAKKVGVPDHPDPDQEKKVGGGKHPLPQKVGGGKHPPLLTRDQRKDQTVYKVQGCTYDHQDNANANANGNGEREGVAKPLPRAVSQPPATEFDTLSDEDFFGELSLDEQLAIRKQPEGLVTILKRKRARTDLRDFQRYIAPLVKTALANNHGGGHAANP